MKTSNLLVALTAGVALTGATHADDARHEMRVRVVEKGPCPIVEVHGDDAFELKAQSRGFLGVEITSLTPELRRHFGVSGDEGVMIGKVVEDSAAFRAGLQVGDIVTRVDDRTIEGSWDLTSAIRESEGGETVSIEFWRDGSVQQMAVTLDERETCTFDMSSLASSLEELREVLPGLQMQGLQIGQEAMEEVMESLRGIDWEEHMEKIEGLQIEKFDVRMEELEERMEELGERLAIEGDRIRVEQVRVLEDGERQRIEREIEVRSELSRARIEARRQATESRVRASQARHEAAEAARAEAEAHAEAVIEEAERAAARVEAEVEAEIDGGGVI